jgi:hypothetical protein
MALVLMLAVPLYGRCTPRRCAAAALIVFANAAAVAVLAHYQFSIAFVPFIRSSYRSSMWPSRRLNNVKRPAPVCVIMLVLICARAPS